MVMMVRNFTNYDIQALVDDELSHEDQKHVLNHIESNLSAKKRYEELKVQKAMIQKWFKTMKSS